MSGVRDLNILTPNGYMPFEGVFRKKAKCLELTFDHKTIICSTDHRFDVDDFEIMAENLKVGDVINGHKLLNIKKLRKRYVYSPINVANGHKYISSDLVHHNCSFIGSSVTLVDANYLDKMMPGSPIRVEYNYCLKIFEDPIPRLSICNGCRLFHRCR